MLREARKVVDQALSLDTNNELALTGLTAQSVTTVGGKSLYDLNLCTIYSDQKE
jgi:hypothetical protein